MDTFQIQMACTRALLNERQGKMKTRSVFSEVLYSLSPLSSVNILSYYLIRLALIKPF